MKRFAAVFLALVALAVLLPGLLKIAPETSAQGSITHSGSGKAIDILNVGDSYAAGNGGGAYFDSSYDDPAYSSGSGCYRSHNNAAESAYRMLGSKGIYINRACSGKLIGDVLPQVGNLSSAIRSQIDLINYSAGGNNAKFSDLAKHCIILPGIPTNGDTVSTEYGEVTEVCSRDIDFAKELLLPKPGEKYGQLAEMQKNNLNALLSNEYFPNAKIVLNGYPFLMAAPDASITSVASNTMEFAYYNLFQIQKEFTKQQKELVAELNLSGDRVAYNDLFNLYGVGRGIGAGANSWLIEELDLPVAEVVHPNYTGWQQSANGIVQAINTKDWFTNYPTLSRQANFYYEIVDNPVLGASAVLRGSDGERVEFEYPPGELRNWLSQCQNGSKTVKGWAPTASHPTMTFGETGIDDITINCVKAKAGDILTFKRTNVSYLGNVGPSGSLIWQEIPTAWMYSCLAGKAGVRVFQGDNLGVGGTINRSKVAGTSDCVPGSWRNKVISGPNGRSFFVDGGGVKHHILSTETYAVLIERHGGAVALPYQVDVDAIPQGGDQQELLRAWNYRNSILCRNDNVCWAVDGSGVRHHIPTHADNVCWRWVNGWRVSRAGVNYSQANSLREAGAWGCNLDGFIIATTSGHSYYMQGNTRRWIPDSESFHCYTHRSTGRSYRGTIRGMSLGEASGIHEIGRMPKCLNRDWVKNRVVRVSDGTAYFVDRNGYWYWIPNGSVWNSLTRKYGIYTYSTSWEHVNSIRRERGVWANSRM